MNYLDSTAHTLDAAAHYLTRVMDRISDLGQQPNSKTIQQALWISDAILELVTAADLAVAQTDAALDSQAQISSSIDAVIGHLEELKLMMRK